MPESDALPTDVIGVRVRHALGRMSGLPKAVARERASETLRHVGLYEERYRPIGGYSTGMKQRVKLAQALVHDPDLLLLDEPTNGLDPAGRDAMLTLIHRIGNEFGISVVVCSHLLGEVERICDTLIAIDAGRLLRADRVDAMTTGQDVLAVEVDEGTDLLVEELSRARYARSAGRVGCCWCRSCPTARTTRSCGPSPTSNCRCTGSTSADTTSPSCSRAAAARRRTRPRRRSSHV